MRKSVEGGRKHKGTVPVLSPTRAHRDEPNIPLRLTRRRDVSPLTERVIIWSNITAAMDRWNPRLSPSLRAGPSIRSVVSGFAAIA
jgi:hypothetical protein